MPTRFSRPALLYNNRSGSYDDAIHQQIIGACRAAGAPIVATFALPDAAPPDAAALHAHDADLLLVWSGDGTINAAAAHCADWDGALLPLPGGTLNLLSKRLHGDRPATDILVDALGGDARRARLPTIRSAARDALITVIAGPATRWAGVRETMRDGGLIEASREAPRALDAMMNAPGVRIAGGDGPPYAAIILTPTPDAIAARGILTDGTGDVLRHGIAWLGGDFRNGPSEAIARAATIALDSDCAISIEYDGELTEIAAPARFSIGRSAVDFLATA